MQFSHLNKAIAAFIGALLAILSLVFKSDLGQYGDVATSLIVALVPIAVYAVPNFAKKVSDDGADVGIVDAVGSVAGGLKVSPAK